MTFRKITTYFNSLLRISFLWKWILLYQVAITSSPCCCFTFVIKNMVVMQMTAIVGESAYLPCDISADEETGDFVLLVLWYREDLGTPIFSVDGRGREFVVAERWSDDGAFSNRAYFLPDRKPAQLVVEKLVIDDSGLYRCRVDFKTGQSRNSRVNLTVVVPPRRLLVLDDNDIEKHAIVGPFVEGATIILRCIVYEGSPIPWIKWYKDDKEMPSNYTSFGQEEERASLRSDGLPTASSVLMISNINRNDVNSMLHCRAGNNDKTMPLESVLRVDMNLEPLAVNILGGNQPLTENRRYDLLCQSSGSRPPASITWWKNGIRLDKTKDLTSIDGNTTTSTVSILPRQSDAGKHLICRANNNVLQTKPLEDGWILDIYYLPEPSVRLGTNLNAENIREGVDVYFDCVIRSHPTVYKVEWRHDSRILSHNIANGVIVSNQSLVLQGVDRESAGNYTCVGFNQEGAGESKPFSLDVLYAPKCSANQLRVLGIAKQEKAQITCQVDANPPDVRYRWVFNNSADNMDFAAGHLNRAGTSSVVSYIPLTEIDYGTLLCWASNSIGEQKVPCVYHIIAAGRPDQVQNCSVMNASLTSFTVSCFEGFNGGLPQSFILEVRDRESQELKVNTTSPVPRFTAANLKPGTNYIVAVLAYNIKGSSEPYVLQAATIRPPLMHHVQDEDYLSFRKYMYSLAPSSALLCGGVFVLLISIIFIAVVRNRCKKKNKREEYKVAGGQVSPSDSSDAMHPLRSPSSENKIKVRSLNGLMESTEGVQSEDCNPDLISDRIADIQHISTIESNFMCHNYVQHNMPFGYLPPPTEFGESCCSTRRTSTEITVQSEAYNTIRRRQEHQPLCSHPRPEQFWAVQPSTYTSTKPLQSSNAFPLVHSQHSEAGELAEDQYLAKHIHATLRRTHQRRMLGDAHSNASDSIPLTNLMHKKFSSVDGEWNPKS